MRVSIAFRLNVRMREEAHLLALCNQPGSLNCLSAECSNERERELVAESPGLLGLNCLSAECSNESACQVFNKINKKEKESQLPFG